MNVHSRGVVLEQRFGHERRSHFVLAGGILDHVLVDHQVVSHAGERSEAHVYFVLAAGRYFMVMGFNLDPERLHREHHFGAESLHAVGRGNRKVSLFRARLMAQIRRFLLAGVPAALAGIDFVEGVVDALSVAHLVEYEELRLRTEVARIGAAGAAQISLGLLGNEAGVAAIGLTGHRLPDVANQDQGRRGGKRVEEGRRRIRDDQHVAFWISWKPRIDEPSNPMPSLSASTFTALGGTEKCCHTPGKSVNRRSIIWTFWSLIAFRRSSAVVQFGIMASLL